MNTVPGVLEVKVLTLAERETFRDRQEDHYGLIEENWPRVGLRVPYFSKSFSRMGPRGPLVTVPEPRLVQNIHPLLQQVVYMKPWDGGQAGPSGMAGIESDDEGDWFREVILKGEGPRLMVTTQSRRSERGIWGEVPAHSGPSSLKPSPAQQPSTRCPTLQPPSQLPTT
ncbi:hypothetical protein BDU57DRAFT_104957 [Ampelomyces quisqualis]|uniref:Uncharacterized protein n=1 Tax=Ampelomyces quisqualis TaxID=50730 RepID=A0A6A5QB14_AMPQU|nr:hypothetical protein BDU57DRAFT_104957 [Ampelomyces quisqualis]